MTDHAMPNDIESDKDLHDAFGKKGQQSAPSPFKHPDEAHIIKRAYDLLSEIPAGKELIPLIKEYDIRIEAVVAKECDSVVHDKNRIILNIPKAFTDFMAFEVALDLGLAIKEVEIKNELNQIVNLDFDQTSHLVSEKIYLMFVIATEFNDLKGHGKLVDNLDKLGYSIQYRQYKSNTSKEVIKESILSALIKKG
jgi:hypothetical protein